jgi:hypothetical protein
LHTQGVTEAQCARECLANQNCMVRKVFFVLIYLTLLDVCLLLSENMFLILVLSLASTKLLDNTQGFSRSSNPNSADFREQDCWLKSNNLDAKQVSGLYMFLNNVFYVHLACFLFFYANFTHLILLLVHASTFFTTLPPIAGFQWLQPHYCPLW